MEMAKLEIPKKDVTEDECLVDSDDDFQDPPPKKINERSKKKQKVNSSTPVAKEPAGKKQVNIGDAHTQTRTLPHRAAKAAVMKTPVFKPIPTRQASSSKIKEEKKNSYGYFSSDTEVEAQQIDYTGVETSPQQFSPIVDQNLDENQDGTKGCTDLHPDKTNIQIDSQYLIPDELLQSINLDYNLSEKIVHHDDRITDEKLDDTNLSDSQFTIPDELLLSLKAYRRESTMRHPLATSEEEQIDEYFNNKKSKSVVQEHCQKNKEKVGSSSKADMHGEVDVVLPDSQDTILDDLLPTLNVYSSKSIIVHPSANREIQTPIAKLRIRRPFKFKESTYTMKFGSAAESSEGHILIFLQKHPFVYHPIDGIVDTKIVNKFRDWISEDLLKVHAKRKENADHYKRGKSTIPMMHFRIETVEDKNWFYIMGFPDQSWTDSHIDVCFYYLRKKLKYDPNRSYKFSTVDCNFMNIISSFHDVYFGDAENLMAGGHVAYVNEYINGFRMHAAVPWHTVEDIYILVNIKEKHHWVLAILSFSERCIFLYDSYESSEHYSAILDVIEKLAAIIPLCLEHCDFYVKKGIHVENHPRYKDKDSSDMFDVLFQENLPQQPSGSLDCGVYMVTYAECLSYGHKILATELDPNTLRTRYAATLWDYGTIKQELNTHGDVEAPLRPLK
ncbi:hypothetical protein T459_04136 [Capsicum annuum]|uniref:Ubiquitin-like protease family profile domain-containing protein n=1 Tax=Capsicum annuum TaxID=4072 RepID=A0A2G3A4A2_CAPAN|nr:hypothetical protein T459_04136 [Capsicum annuum]